MPGRPINFINSINFLIMAGSKGSKYYNVFLRYTLNLEDSSDKSILDAEGFELLIKIRKLKSIVAAAKEMGISYRKAWGDLKQAEELLGYQLTEKTRGGKDGGQSLLTPAANKLLEAYAALQEKLDDAVEEAYAELKRKMEKE